MRGEKLGESSAVIGSPSLPKVVISRSIYVITLPISVSSALFTNLQIMFLAFHCPDHCHPSKTRKEAKRRARPTHSLFEGESNSRKHEHQQPMHILGTTGAAAALLRLQQ